MAQYRWNVSEHAEGYDQAGPLIHPYYTEIQEEVLRLLEGAGEPACVLDLGGGSGRLIERVLERFDQAMAIVLDQSEAFLGLAERRLARFAERVTLVQARLQEDWAEQVPQPIDAVVSMSAIHHLDASEKQRLYRQAAEILDDSGIFINGDEVRARDDDVYLGDLRAWAQHMEQLIADGRGPDPMAPVMQGWIERNVTNFGQPKVSGDDCHETVEAQLDYLREAGLSTVEATWQRELWAVLVGRKNG